VTLKSYCPFQNVWTTKKVLTSGWFVAMMIAAVVCGFFDAFNYAIITDKINICLSLQALMVGLDSIICTGMCVLITV